MVGNEFSRNIRYLWGLARAILADKALYYWYVVLGDFDRACAYLSFNTIF